jgi:para-nitrobenzyl esterase
MLALVFAFVVGSAAVFASTVTVVTPSGAVTGNRGPHSVEFLGIPYAEAPVGALRWAPPVAKRPWAELNATAFGPGW